MVPHSYTHSSRIGDLVIEADLGYSVSFKDDPILNGADHGWDPARYKEMHGVFMAIGPAFRQGLRLPTMHALDIYGLLCQMFGFDIDHPIDGSLGFAAIPAAMPDNAPARMPAAMPFFVGWIASVSPVG